MGEVGLVDLAILVLLCGGIGYGYLVSRRLERLRSALIAFGPVLEQFCEAVGRSEKSVRDLRIESGRLGTAGSSGPDRPTDPESRAALMATLTDFIRKRRH